MAFLDVIELVGEAVQVLSLEDNVYRVAGSCLAPKSILVVRRLDIILQAVVNLADTRLIIDGLAIFAQMLRGLWSIGVRLCQMDLLADAVISMVVSTERHPTCWSDTRVRVLAGSTVLVTS